MESVGTAEPGLRERKKQRTRETIVRAALELFAERGYEQTTIADIARAADVSPRTVFGYFESKEEIFFSDKPDPYDALKAKLEGRPAGTTTVDALREFVRDLDPPDDCARLRDRVLVADEGLRLRLRSRIARVEELLARSIAQDLGAPPGDIRPTLVAASLTAALTTLRERLAEAGAESVSYEQSMAMLEDVLEFLRGGLEALQQAR